MKKTTAFLVALSVFAVAFSQSPQIRRTGFANYPAELGAGWHQTGFLGTYLKSISKTADAVTVAGQDSSSDPVTFTLNREIFVPSPTAGLIDVTAQMFEAGRVTYWNGEVYGARRNVEHEASGLNVDWSDYAATDFDGTVESLSDLPSCASGIVDRYRFVRDQIQGFQRCYRVGVNTYLWQPHSPTATAAGRWIGRFANEAQADSHATGLNDIAYWHDATSNVPQIVTTFQLPQTAAYTYYWDSLVDVVAWALSGENSLIPVGKLVFGTPTDGQVPVWNTANSRLQWGNRTVGDGGATSFAELTGTIGDLQIPDDRITRRMVNDDTITRDELHWNGSAPGLLKVTATGEVFDAGLLQTADIQDGVVTAPKLAAVIRELHFQGTWSSTVNYPRGATVVHNDELWQAETNPPPGNEPRNFAGSLWKQISNSVQWRGASSSLTSYRTGDVVTHSTDIYIFTGSTTTSPPPAEGWVSLTATGTTTGASSFDDLTGTINDAQIPDNRIIDRMINFSTIGTDKLDLETRNALAQQGDITGVAAGEGLAGGGDSGSVSIRLGVGGVSNQYIADSTIQLDKLSATAQATINQKLSTVATDATLAGNGTSGNMLSVAEGAIQTPYLRDGAVTPAKASQALLDMIAQDGQPGWSSDVTLPYRNPVSGTDAQFRWGGVAFPFLAFRNLTDEDENLVRSILPGTVAELNSRRFSITSFSVNGDDLRLNGTFGPPVPNFSQGTSYRIRLSQARVGGPGPIGLQGIQGEQGDVSTVIGEGDGMVRTLIHGAASVGTIVANDWGQIPGQSEGTWDGYDWIEFYLHRSSDQWTGRIRINEDTRMGLGTVNVGTSDASTDVSADTVTAGSHPSFVSLGGDTLIFTSSHLPANTNIYIGSPTATLTGGQMTIWGLSEGAVTPTAGTHQLTEAEVTDSTSTQFGLISGQRAAQAVLTSVPAVVSQAEAEAGAGTVRRSWTAQRVRQGANAAINQRVIRVEHTPPAATEANEDALIIVSSTGDGFLQRQETIHGTAAQATWENYPISPTGYVGAFGNAPTTIPANGRYYNYGLRIWFQAVLYAGSYRWVSGGEPIGWRGYAPSENVAAANNVDGVSDLVYIANLYSIRRVLTFTPGSNSTIQRTWENQREDEFHGTASAASAFYEPGEIAVVTTNNNPRAYICLVAGEYTSAAIPLSTQWLRVSPPVRTPVLTDDTPPDNVKDLDFTGNYSRFRDTGFDWDIAEQSAITIEVSVGVCNIELNRSFHPDQFDLLMDVSIQTANFDYDGPGDTTRAISWAGSAAHAGQGTDCRVWLGKDVDDNILMAVRPSVVSGDAAQPQVDLRMWRVE